MNSLNSVNKYIMRLRIQRAVKDIRDLEEVMTANKRWECTPVTLLALIKLIKPVSKYLPDAGDLTTSGIVIETSFRYVGEMLDWLDSCIDFVQPKEDGSAKEITKDHLNQAKRIQEVGVSKVFFINHYYISPKSSLDELETRLTDLVAQINQLSSSKTAYYNLRFRDGLSQFFAFLESLIRVLIHVETKGLVRENEWGQSTT